MRKWGLWASIFCRLREALCASWNSITYKSFYSSLQNLQDKFRDSHNTVGQCSEWSEFPPGRKPRRAQTRYFSPLLAEDHPVFVLQKRIISNRHCFAFLMEDVKTWAPEVVRKKKYHVCFSMSSASTYGINLLGARNYCLILIKRKLSFVLPDPEEMVTYFSSSH